MQLKLSLVRVSESVTILWEAKLAGRGSPARTSLLFQLSDFLLLFLLPFSTHGAKSRLGQAIRNRSLEQTSEALLLFRFGALSLGRLAEPVQFSYFVFVLPFLLLVSLRPCLVV